MNSENSLVNGQKVNNLLCVSSVLLVFSFPQYRTFSTVRGSASDFPEQAGCQSQK